MEFCILLRLVHALIISQSFQSIWKEVGILLRLLSLMMYLICNLCCPFNIQVRTYLRDLDLKKKPKTPLSLACIQTFSDQFPSFNITGMQEARASVPNISQSCGIILIEFGLLLRLVLMNLIFVWSTRIHIQGRVFYLRDFILKIFIVTLQSDIWRPVTLTFVVVLQKIKLCILIQFAWPWPLFKVTSVWEIKNFCTIFVANFSTSFLKHAATACWNVKAFAKFILYNWYPREI